MRALGVKEANVALANLGSRLKEGLVGTIKGAGDVAAAAPERSARAGPALNRKGSGR